MVEPGSVILGKYRIERILGSGGMGVVALAQHLHLQEPMAIKFLQPNMLDKHEIVQRFLREAQAAVKLKGEHVCRVFDVGTLDTGAPYMVMEYLHGVDLSAYRRDRGALPLAVTVDIMIQACAALSEAHALGIVHRDVKPANFFLTQRTDGSPLVKLLDFGISKAINQIDADLTSTNATLGTPAYMSPEQLRSSKDVDTRTDIWALGVILYQLVSGDRPFKADTFSALCLKVAMEPPPPLDIPLPHGFADIVMRCLEKEPAARFQTVDELADALAPYQDLSLSRPRRAGSRAGSMLGISASSASPRTTGANPMVPLSRPTPTTLSDSAGHVAAASQSGDKRRSNLVWIAAAAAAVLVGVLVGGFLVSGSGDDAERAAASETVSPESASPDHVRDTGDLRAANHTAAAPAAGFPGETAGAEEIATETATDTGDDPAGPQVEMHEPPASQVYTLQSDPDGADVLLDGERVGETPYQVELLDGDTQRYTIARRGHVDRELTLPDDADDAGLARVELKRKKRRTKKKSKLDKGETLDWD